VSEFSISGRNFTACTEATVICGDIQLGEYQLGCQTHQFLTDDCDVNTCFNGCSGHGVCQDGTCACVAGFSGIDCSVAVSNGCISANVGGTDFETCLSTAITTCNTLQVTLSGDSEKTWYFSLPDLEATLPPPSCYDAFPGCQLCVTLKELDMPDDDIGTNGGSTAIAVTGKFAFGLTCAGLPMGEFPDQSFSAPLDASCAGQVCIVSTNDSALLMDQKAMVRLEAGQKWFGRIPIPQNLDVMEIQFILSIPEFNAEFDIYTSTMCHPTLENFENHMHLSGPANSPSALVTALNCSDTTHANTMAGMWYVGVLCSSLNNCTGSSCPRCNIGVTPHMLLSQNISSQEGNKTKQGVSAFSMAPSERRYFNLFSEGKHKPLTVQLDAAGGNIGQVLVGDLRCMSSASSTSYVHSKSPRVFFTTTLEAGRHFMQVQACGENQNPINVTLSVHTPTRSVSIMFIFLAILLAGVLIIIGIVGYRSYVQHWQNPNYTETNPDRGRFQKLDANAPDSNLDEDGLETGDVGGRAAVTGGTGGGDTLTLEEDGAEEIN